MACAWWHRALGGTTAILAPAASQPFTYSTTLHSTARCVVNGFTFAEGQPWFTHRRASALPAVSDEERESLDRIRNIGISAHIDSGKTTLTERILFYTGRIKAIHEVRGKDGVGAKMDHMELEREKGITIQSAATFTRWHNTHINIIDTPGHVDFTIEVERALRVLDGAILVLCSVGGVQSQTLTVDRQMRRYSVPRLAFINKCDRAGANPWAVVEQLRGKLKQNCAAVQVPVGLEDQHVGLVDLVRMRALYFDGKHGDTVQDADIPGELQALAEEKRQELVECVAEVDEQLGELFLAEEAITADALSAAIRRATVARTFIPVFMGSAFKNRGVQPLLDGVEDYLPCPLDVENTALDVELSESAFVLPNNPKGPLVAYAFKLEEGRYGQLTFLRLYSGTLQRGANIVNVNSGKRIKVPRVVRIHSDEMEDIDSAGAGEIVAMFGVECASGDTFTDGSVRYSMTSITVPAPVVSLAISPKEKGSSTNFGRALNRFQKEDPTFRVHLDPETSETIISGMGELHLEVYVERMRREYGVDCETGAPKVNYREAISGRSEFNYLHKKQSGGSGQFGRVIGSIEPLPEDSEEMFVFENRLVGQNVPPQFVPAIEKGFREAVNAGSLIGHPVERVKVVLTDGQSHPVDSSEMAFKIAAIMAFRQAYAHASPMVLEPVMKVEITAPQEFQGTIIGDINRRRGMILDSATQGDDAVISCTVALEEMFGYSMALRSQTQGKGEFTMEYSHRSPVTKDTQEQLTSHYAASRRAKA